MSLDVFFAEMRKELALTSADFDTWLATLATSDPSGPGFQEAAEGYSAQLLRIGATSEMLGMSGLSTWTMAVNSSLMAMAEQSAAVRADVAAYLKEWPTLVDAYFAEPAEADVARKLTDYASESRALVPLDASASAALFDALCTPPVVPEELLEELAQSEAPAVVTESDVSLVLREDADVDVYNAFIDEAPSKTVEFSVLTNRISRGQATDDDMRNAKRIAHSFKGSANIVGIRGIASLGHYTEDILEHFEKTHGMPPRALALALVEASDCLAQMVGHLRGEEEAPDSSFETLSKVVAWANRIKSGDDLTEEIAADVPSLSSSNNTSAAARPPTQPAPSTQVEPEASLRVPVRTVDELFRLVGELTTRIGRLETRAKSASKRAKDMLTQNLAVQQRVLDLEKLVVLRGLSLTHTNPTDGTAEFDPLEMDRYNELHGATRSLVEVTADAREIASSIENDIAEVTSEILQQSVLNKDLQYQVVSTRMTPVSVLNQRLLRNVRQTCQQTGKEAELFITGSETQLDGDVLNRLADPLLHILRNAVDHGIEPPDVRKIVGKSGVGVINLSFARQGTAIVVVVQDDGRGLDFERIREKAIEKGLIKSDQVLSETDLARLILLPGFSTRDDVSEVSGRGVGMDVVASRLAELKGSVEVSSSAGQGSTVTLRLQASLVTQHALLVNAADQIFGIPSHNVTEAVAGGLGETLTVNDAPVFVFREVTYPLRDLATLTGYPVEHSSAEWSAMPKVIVRAEGQPYALVVSRVLDSRELIVKGLGDFLRRLHGVSGAALLGDGTVVPFLNVADLLVSPLAITEAVVKLAAEARRQAKRVLVVDDSLSVRKSLIQLFEDAAYEVRSAGDGLEAVRMLDEFHPNVVCTDLEMPNMNGLELTAHLRGRQTTRELPIIMITSRSMDKHREQAVRVGVNYYVTKPYTEQDLLSTMQHAMDRVVAGPESFAAQVDALLAQ
jgi:chemotaxis protein histidine kinase CheA/AmiR/NasT family two-component response regulator